MTARDGVLTSALGVLVPLEGDLTGSSEIGALYLEENRCLHSYQRGWRGSRRLRQKDH